MRQLSDYKHGGFYESARRHKQANERVRARVHGCACFPGRDALGLFAMANFIEKMLNAEMAGMTSAAVYI